MHTPGNGSASKPISLDDIDTCGTWQISTVWIHRPQTTCLVRSFLTDFCFDGHRVLIMMQDFYFFLSSYFIFFFSASASSSSCSSCSSLSLCYYSSVCLSVCPSVCLSASLSLSLSLYLPPPPIFSVSPSSLSPSLPLSPPPLPPSLSPPLSLSV